MREHLMFTGITKKKGKRQFPTLVFTGEMVQQIVGELVYAWFRDFECLYVGYTKCGLSRFKGSHVITQGILPTDEFHIFLGGTRELELELIHEWQPKYNKIAGWLFPKRGSGESFMDYLRSLKTFGVRHSRSDAFDALDIGQQSFDER